MNNKHLLMDRIIDWPYHDKLLVWGMGVICFIALTAHNMATETDFWLAELLAIPVSMLAGVFISLLLACPYIIGLYLMAFIAEILACLYRMIRRRLYPPR